MALQQALPSEGIHRERPREAGVIRYGACHKIDPERILPPCGRRGRHPPEELIHVGLIEPDRHHAVLKAVIEEDVGERRRDHGPEAVVGQSPRGMLAAGAAAKVPPRQEDARPGRRRLVELELRVRRAVGQEPPVEEQILAKPRPLDPLEELLGNDLVGIDVGPVEGGDDT